MTSNALRRRPGRPPQTEEEQARARAHIARATSAVFAEHGYHGMSVARILERAGIARPTFYRYFRNVDEPLRMALIELGGDLHERIMGAVGAVDGDLTKVIAAVDAYLRWSGEHRHLLRSLYAGVHDPTSPVSALRPLLVDAMIKLLVKEFVAAGRQVPDRWLLDVYVNTVEYTCFRVHLATEGAQGDIATARRVMLRAGLALLGTRDDWLRFLDMPDVLDDAPPAAAPASSSRRDRARRGHRVGTGEPRRA